MQLIVKVQTEANNTDDAAMLNEALPELKAHTDAEEMYTGGPVGRTYALRSKPPFAPSNIPLMIVRCQWWNYSSPFAGVSRLWRSGERRGLGLGLS